MSKYADYDKAMRIIRGGFTLPAEIEGFFTEAKRRAVETMKKAREYWYAELKKFDQNWKSEYAAIPEEQLIVRDPWLGKRKIQEWEYHTCERAKITKMIPFFGEDEATAVRKTEEDCNDKRVQFIIRTNAITGDTINEAVLNIDCKSGDVNGTITGCNGTAKVKTIGAGGYNIQRYHFRCLIRKVG